MSSATAPLLGPGGVAPAQPKHGRLALLSASLLLASAIFLGGKSGCSMTGLWSWDAARRHRAADEAADGRIGGSSPTGLWSWGDAWSTLHSAAAKAANGTSSAIKGALNSSAANRVEHGIEQGAESAEHEAERALNSSAIHKVEGSAEQGFQGAKEEAQRALRSSAAHQVEGTAEEGFQAAGNAAARGLNSSAAHKAESAAEQGFETAKSGAQQALNATQAAKSKLDQLGGRIANYTVHLSPQCVRALELGAVVATGTLAAPALIDAVGFTAEGVAAESLASLWQSTIGDVEEGSVFARLQSLGASGIVAQTSLRAAGIEGVLAVAYCDAASAMCSSCSITVIEEQG